MAIHEKFMGPGPPDPLDDDRCCQQCGYVLKGLEPGTNCPECGVAEYQDTGTTESPEAAPVRKRKPPKCRGCGYILLGLPASGKCPECGRPYRPNRDNWNRATLIPDRVLQSIVWRWGLLLMSAGTFVALCMQVAVLVHNITTPEYTLTMAIASLAWSLGLWVSLPSTLDAGSNSIRGLRYGTIFSQWLWPAGFMAIWFITSDKAGSAADVLWIVSIVTFVLGAIGVVGVMSFLIMTSKDLYMRECAGRFQFTAILFPIYAIGIWIAPYPAYVTEGISATPAGGLNALVYVVVLGPWWAMFLMVLYSLLQLLNRGYWETRIQDNLSTRSERVAEKRAAMDAKLGAEQVGPTTEPPPVSSPYWEKSGDIPLSDPDKTDAT
ncbi:MAG: hypothetical protein VX527_06475 [Planctomycetota bacterium]|nr:hypothetical protein [Planctomycetota bacterium]